jgi:hypothetical protein
MRPYTSTIHHINLSGTAERSLTIGGHILRADYLSHSTYVCGLIPGKSAFLMVATLVSSWPHSVQLRANDHDTDIT